MPPTIAMPESIVYAAQERRMIASMRRQEWLSLVIAGLTHRIAVAAKNDDAEAWQEVKANCVRDAIADADEIQSKADVRFSLE